MANITSKFNEPTGAFLVPIGETTDLTTNGKGVVHRPNYLETSDFSDSGDDLASIDGKTFEGDGNNYFVNQCIRIGGDDGSNYVVTAVDGTTGTDTITLDRDIKEDAGDDVYTSNYFSIQKATDPENSDRINDNDNYNPRLYIYILLKSGYATGQVNIIVAGDYEFTDFNPNLDSDLSLVPIKKIVLDDNNVLDTVYFCKGF